MIYNYKIAMNNKTFDDTEENFVFDSKMSLPDAIWPVKLHLPTTFKNVF